MSIIEHTTKLQLNKFSGSSINPAFLEYYTEDMEKLDQFATEVDSRLSTLETNYGTYDSRIEALETWEVSVDATLAGYGSRLDTLEETVALLDTQYVEDLRDRLTALEVKVDTNTSQIESLNNDINQLENADVQLNNTINTLAGRVTTSEGRLDVLEQCCNEVRVTLGNLQTQITTNKTEIDALKVRMTTAENNIAGNARDIITVATQTRVNTSDIAELKEKIDGVDPVKKTDSVSSSGLVFTFSKLSGWTKLVITGSTSVAIADGYVMQNVVPEEFESSEISTSRAVQPVTVNDILINVTVDGRNVTFHNVNGAIASGTTLHQEVMYC